MAQATIEWAKGSIKLIDQTLLPHQLKYIYCRDIKTLWQAIRQLSVRGAPALGAAAAYGVLLASEQFKGRDAKKFTLHIKKTCDYIATSRPTAVNLFHALTQMQNVLTQFSNQPVLNLKALLKQEALMIAHHDQTVCRQMGGFGATLIKNDQTYLTVCNAGALATVDFGTALGVFYSAKEKGNKFKVIATETRPLLQGARLTTWELLRAGIDTTLICDNMAASVMNNQKIDGIFAGADRIAANGDAANKIGTYSLAVLAKYHHVPFYIVAPFSTFDFSASSGKDIPIEQRDAKEVKGFGSVLTAPKNVKVLNPAFDVTEHKLITAIITEGGIIKAPFKSNIKKAHLEYERQRKQ